MIEPVAEEVGAVLGRLVSLFGVNEPFVLFVELPGVSDLTPLEVADEHVVIVDEKGADGRQVPVSAPLDPHRAGLGRDLPPHRFEHGAARDHLLGRPLLQIIDFR
ncbi:hypothetical protein [Spongiactinospora gelatinilytica]|uniref:hypothetical protein n=1 Tax=Spongiactinospora gelatinilytica TaxID=2666298 RepID=UPI0011B9398F|nr:hypothetical protein [Spongiactinospora gelatinilytica]